MGDAEGAVVVDADEVAVAHFLVLGKVELDGSVVCSMSVETCFQHFYVHPHKCWFVGISSAVCLIAVFVEHE